VGTTLLFDFLRVIWAVPAPERFRPCNRPEKRLSCTVATGGDAGGKGFSHSLGTRVLSGERELSKTHVRKLAEHFKLNPGYFL
jgi:hypothetical protein